VSEKGGCCATTRGKRPRNTTLGGKKHRGRPGTEGKPSKGVRNKKATEGKKKKRDKDSKELRQREGTERDRLRRGNKGGGKSVLGTGNPHNSSHEN